MEISPELAELVGALIGDGFIYNNFNKYRIGFTGNQINDKAYFDFLKGLILKVWNKEAKIKERWRGLRIVINSKEAVTFLINELKLPFGEGKCEKVTIPKEIIDDWGLAKYAIRGIVDTDGSVFVAKKPGIDKYPSIEITTVSSKLALQLKNILEKQGFRVAKIWAYKSKFKKGRITYKVPLNGKKNIIKWINEIGFSNPYKLQRAIESIKN
jgi:DNA-binding transcriptional regulator WhiA